eukprot:TRINITY_DN739_c0_g1_i2.p1 TRINITY_DN739_c0_g1~~TRINITY_DN739_c0_g1_i2.p1  ORF type:complete len:486 (-),score=85.15 TRINITY_DN739_c0_g1_i2:131-1588(-)
MNDVTVATYSTLQVITDEEYISGCFDVLDTYDSQTLSVARAPFWSELPSDFIKEVILEGFPNCFNRESIERMNVTFNDMPVYVGGDQKIHHYEKALKSAEQDALQDILCPTLSFAVQPDSSWIINELANVEITKKNSRNKTSKILQAQTSPISKSDFDFFNSAIQQTLRKLDYLEKQRLEKIWKHSFLMNVKVDDSKNSLDMPSIQADTKTIVHPHVTTVNSSTNFPNSSTNCSTSSLNFSTSSPNYSPSSTSFSTNFPYSSTNFPTSSKCLTSSTTNSATKFPTSSSNCSPSSTNFQYFPTPSSTSHSAFSTSSTNFSNSSTNYSISVSTENTVFSDSDNIFTDNISSSVPNESDTVDSISTTAAFTALLTDPLLQQKPITSTIDEPETASNRTNSSTAPGSLIPISDRMRMNKNNNEVTTSSLKSNPPPLIPLQFFPTNASLRKPEEQNKNSKSFQPKKRKSRNLPAGPGMSCTYVFQFAEDG